MRYRSSRRSREADLGRMHKAHMKRSLEITSEPISEAALLAQRRTSDDAGAVVCFLGIVRRTEDEFTIRAIEYEAFQQMAEHQFHLLFDAVEKKWPIESVRLIHRVGVVPVNEPSLWVEVVAGHRQEAFAACQWLIDQMKQVVPIWKKPIQQSKMKRMKQGKRKKFGGPDVLAGTFRGW